MSVKLHNVVADIIGLRCSRSLLDGETWQGCWLMSQLLTWRGYLLGGLIVLLAVACANGDNDSKPFAQEAAPSRDPGVVHVHGLAVNPKDGALYAATHTGLFRVADGVATRVGDRYQDTMGFVIAGPDRFFGSGHPDMRDYTAGKLPGLLGFIESKDAGLTWSPQALLGKADFHALTISAGMIYGFDVSGGKLWRSANGKRWEERGSLPVISVAGNPTAVDTLVAATASGIQLSRDGARSWNRASDLVGLVSWTSSGLFAVDGQGRTFHSGDEGKTWAARGTLPGPPEAFVATQDRLFAAVMEQGIFVSNDGGATWSLYFKGQQ